MHKAATARKETTDTFPSPARGAMTFKGRSYTLEMELMLASAIPGDVCSSCGKKVSGIYNETIDDFLIVRLVVTSVVCLTENKDVSDQEIANEIESSVKTKLYGQILCGNCYPDVTKLLAK